MKNSELNNILLKKCETLDLKNNAFAMFENIFTQNPANEIPEIFNGLSKEDIVYKFQGYSFNITDKKSSIETRLSIQTKLNEEIGWYVVETSFDGEFLDEYLNLYSNA